MFVNAAEAIRLLSTLNNQHPAIKFELELPTNESGNSLSLLDFTVRIQPNEAQGLYFDFYRKTARKDIFVHSDSALPSHSKLAIARNERRRIHERCSEEGTRDRHDSRFNETLQRHGYSEEFIRHSRTLHRPSTQRQQQRDQGPIFYLEVPYLGDRTDYALRRSFRREGMNVRIYHRSYSLRTALNNQRPAPTTCALNGCSINSGEKCLAKNVVYELTCPRCLLTYIGSTIRHLHTRVREHLQQATSSYHSHCTTCQRTPYTANVKILARERDAVDVRLKEALLIAKRRPALNSREEREDLHDFIFL